MTKGSVTAVLPTATLIPKDWPLIVLSLKDCFYPIHIQPDDKMRFTFSVPSVIKNLSFGIIGMYYLKARQTSLLRVNTI